MRRIPWKNAVLFALTCLTTLIAGAYQSGVDPFAEGGSLMAGLPYAFGLIIILLTHEMGHYIAARYHNVKATLPFFIPVPPELFLFGTMGAVIRMRSPILTRSALLDIGAYGPIAGFVVAVIASFAGLLMSGFAEPAVAGMFRLGEPLGFTILSWLALGPPPPGAEVALHPLAVAGWIGMFVTMLNLMPMGQLDGGHIVCAVLGYTRHKRLGTAAVAIMAPVGLMGFLAELGLLGVPHWLTMYCWPGWAIWAVLLSVIGLRHPPVYYWEPELDRRRRRVAMISLVIFILTFMPVPITVV